MEREINKNSRNQAYAFTKSWYSNIFFILLKSNL